MHELEFRKVIHGEYVAPVDGEWGGPLRYRRRMFRIHGGRGARWTASLFIRVGNGPCRDLWISGPHRSAKLAKAACRELMEGIAP